jgi:hypothetical protein
MGCIAHLTGDYIVIIKIDAKGVTKAKAAIAKCVVVLKRIDSDFVNGQNIPFAPQFSCFRLFLRTATMYGMLREVEAPEPYFTNTGVWLKTRVTPTLEVTGQSTRCNGSLMKPKFNHTIEPPVTPRPERREPSKLSLIGRIEDRGGYDAHRQIERLRELRA